MGRPRNPERDKSLQRYLDADGKIGTAELAKLAGVPESRIRKWKSEDSREAIMTACTSLHFADSRQTGWWD